MTRSRLSFCIPAQRGAEALLARSLATLGWQTAPPSTFEVVVGVDGDDPTALERAVAPARLAIDVRFVPSPRTRDVAHRNHARNAALRASDGEYAWIVDSDFLWPPHAVAHALAALAAFDGTRDRGAVLALTPVLARIAADADAWPAIADGIRCGADLVATVATAALTPEYSGFLDAAVAAEAPIVRDVGFIREGFPLAHRAIFDALGGFDEALVGWGANKEELTRRLGRLEGVEYRLLASVTAYHQPHHKDPGRDDADPLTVANRAYFQARLRGIADGAPWWLEQQRRVAAAIPRLRHGHPLATGRT